MRFYCKLILYCCTAFLFSSCQQRMYFPDSVNSPGLKHAMDARLTLSVKPQSDGADSSFKSAAVSPAVDVAFSPVSHFGIIASYHSLLNRTIKEEHTIGLFTVKNVGGKFTGGCYEAGAGYYMNVGGKGLFELYGGLGIGAISRRGLYDNSYDYDARYMRYFLQPAFGFSHKVISLMGGVRVSLQHFNDFTALNDPMLRYTIANDDQPGTDVTQQVFTFVQPFLQLGIGLPYIKFSFQAGYSMPVSGGTISSDPLYCSLGITLSYYKGLFK